MCVGEHKREVSKLTELRVVFVLQSLAPRRRFLEEEQLEEEGGGRRGFFVELLSPPLLLLLANVSAGIALDALKRILGKVRSI